MLDRNRQNPLVLADAADMPALRYDRGHGAEYGYGDRIQDEPGGFNPLQLLFLALKYRFLVITMVVAGLFAGVVFTLTQTPKYRAVSQLEVLVPSAKVFQDLEVVSETTDVRSFLTAREKVKSRGLAQRVAFELGLSERPDFLYPTPDFAVSNLFRRAFGITSSPAERDETPEEREERAIKRLQENLSVELVANTSLLSLTYKDQNPKYAQEIVNQFAQSFIDQRVDQTSETSDLARQFIQDQVIQVKDKLQASEKALVDYAKTTGLSSSGTEDSLITTNIKELNTALSAAIQERLDYARLVQQIDAGQGPFLSQVLESKGLETIRESLAEKKAEYQQKLGMFKPGFPEMQQLAGQIRELERQLNQGVLAITESIKLKHQETINREADLRTKLAELEKQQVEYQDKNIQYTILKRDVDSYRSQYESLIGKLNEVGVGSELKNQNASVVDVAPLPDRPFSPKLSLNLAVALGLFALVTAAIIYALELLNNTFTNPEQVEKELGLAVLGILPAVGERDIQSTLADQKSALSEAYRSLRTSLQFSGTEGTPRTLLVTSSEPSEGKSTTSLKLAQDFAALGARVLLIDADLRKPNLHRLLGLDNAIGLSNLLTNTVRKDDLPTIIRKTNAPNVMVITSGTIPPNPADLLSSPKMALILRSFSEKFDLTIIDAPPIVGLSDAPILSRLAEGTLLVISTNQVTRKAAKTALRRVKAAGGHILGAAMSKFSVSKFDYNYNYSYKYMNYQYYTYGTDTPKLEAGGAGTADAPAPKGKLLGSLGRFFGGGNPDSGRPAQS